MQNHNEEILKTKKNKYEKPKKYLSKYTEKICMQMKKICMKNQNSMEDFSK